MRPSACWSCSDRRRWINGHDWAPFTALLGLLWLLFTLYHWFGDAIAESEGGHYGKNVDKSYRWSMSWFIFSEVMFFGAFFGALFYAREIALHQLGSLDYKLIWPDFSAVAERRPRRARRSLQDDACGRSRR